MPSSSLRPPPHLRWHRITAELVCNRARGSQQSLLSVFEAMMKQTSGQLARHFHCSKDHLATQLKIIFRLPHRYALKHLPIMNQHHRLEIRLFGSRGLAEQWCEQFCHLFYSEQVNNYHLLRLSELNTLAPDRLSLPHLPHTEVALEFFTPFFQRKGQREQIDLPLFITTLENRLGTLFNQPFDLSSVTEEVYLVPWYWRYEKHERQPKSQPGRQYLNGAVGRLYLKGNLQPLLRWLVLAEEVQLGSKLGFGLGHFELQPLSPPYFAPTLFNPATLNHITHDALERYDDAAEALAKIGDNNEQALVDTLLEQMRDTDHLAEPHTAYLLERPDHSPRQIERLHLHELTLHLHLNRLLQPIFNKLFTPDSIGYRKGYSRETAAKRIHQAIEAGYRFVVKADIHDFFPSIDLNRLTLLLERHIPAADSELLRLLQRALHTGYRLGGIIHERSNGLAQGSPLSPLLANLYLDEFDRALCTAHPTMRLIRYADDFICLVKEEFQTEQVLASAEAILADIGLTLAPEKSEIHPIQAGFRFLGIDFGADTNEEPPAPLLKKPLYVTTPGYFLGVTGDVLDIRHQGKLVESLPLHRISELIVLTHASFSTSMVRKCSELNIPIALTMQSGYHTLTITPDSGRYQQIAYQQAIKYHNMSDIDKLALAKSFACAKIATYRYLFRQRYRTGLNELLDKLSETIGSIEAAESVNAVRGYEGIAARACFAELNHHISNPEFHITKRERKNPDRINSLLNFGYYLLFSRINLTIKAMGLNPYLGFLHESGQRYETLSCDVEELFRARVDRLIIRLINLKTITEADFYEREGGGLRLSREATQRFVTHFEREMATPPRGGDESMGKLIHAQAVALRSFFTDDKPLLFFTWGSGWRL
ncbi:CRISPR-associated endonuclease Cas1 [Ectothiorhodospiraceae bacterium BW-2]|nr:CRISPR-associated endonuclease Cas1 [Ectothiorhodospiraceae bacterium BW-2]